MAAIVPTAADSCRVCGAAPLAGATVSQPASDAAVKFSVPVLVLVTSMDAGDGFDELP